jgi:tetratricopeptide (TPR) repeat protein
MTSTLEWSCGLLRDEERALLWRLSVFAGGAPLRAVETVCQAAGELPVSMNRLLGVLVDQHLVRRESGVDDEPRISMLATVREYGRTKLQETSEADATRRAHADHYAAVVSQAESQLIGPDQVACFRRLGAELDNLRAALAWAEEEHGEVEVGLRIAAGLASFWETRRQGREGLRCLERLLTRPGAVRPEVLAAAQEAAGLLSARLGEFDLSRLRHEQSLQLSRRRRDSHGIAAALSGLGLLSFWQGALGEAERLLEEAISIRRAIGDRHGLAVSLNVLGAVVSELGDQRRAIRLYDESLSIYRWLGNRIGISRCLLNLGVSLRRIGDLSRSETSLEEAVTLARDLVAPELLGAALVNLGNVPRSRGDTEAARSLYEEGLRIFSQIGDQRWLAYTLECVAWLAHSDGRPSRAARLYGAATGLRQQFAMPGWPVASSEHVEAVTALRRELGEPRFAEDYEAGRGLSPVEAVAQAIEDA